MNWSFLGTSTTSVENCLERANKKMGRVKIWLQWTSGDKKNSTIEECLQVACHKEIERD